mmetsp:Transcript_11304/g.12413  ORF Transcript_11304/g.12413 Transcript_11304/m.12413 type:complete len:84 (-) Transcript_11304:95-346(-)
MLPQESDSTPAPLPPPHPSPLVTKQNTTTTTTTVSRIGGSSTTPLRLWLPLYDNCMIIKNNKNGVIDYICRCKCHQSLKTTRY